MFTNPLPKAKNFIVSKFESHPLETLAVATFLISSSATVLKAVSEERNSRTWRKEVNRRSRKD